jgi:hypothetical protein
MSDLLREDLLSLKDNLLTIEKEFEEKLAQMEEKKIMFDKVDQKLQDLIKAKDSVIKLDIGGKLFVTRLSVLVGVKDTVFYNLVASYLLKEMTIPTEMFFDRDYTYFPYVLDYLRYKNIVMRNLSRYEREDLIQEIEYFGLDLFKNKKNEIDIEWDQNLSKAGACTVDINDKRSLTVHSNTCYTHFVTNTTFTNENFVIEFESTVTQTDNYYYIGIFNEYYSTSSSCGCCNPTNSYYVQCDGSIHINANKQTNNDLSWYGSPITIGMRVMLSDKEIYFYKNDGSNEIGPFEIISGSNFRVYAGHCNSGNGKLKISTCHYV